MVKKVTECLWKYTKNSVESVENLGIFLYSRKRENRKEGKKDGIVNI